MTTETIETSESELIQTEPDTPATAAEGEVDKTKQDEPAKTFTQAEVDALVQKRLLKEERRVHRRIEQQMREAQQQQTPERSAYQDDEAYLRAHIEHLAEQKAAEKLAERQVRQEAERRSESFLQKADKAAERYPDFQAVVSNPSLPVNEAMAEFIADSDQGAEVAYFLGKNPGKAYEIAQLSPVRAARELAKIEADLAARPQARVSRAPEPITPVGSRGKASTSSLPSDDDDIESWMRKEQARMRQR